MCKRLFFLETTDYIDDESADTAAADGPTAAHPEELAADHDTSGMANALVVSLHAVAGIQPPNAMLLPVAVKGAHFLALLDAQLRPRGCDAPPRSLSHWWRASTCHRGQW